MTLRTLLLCLVLCLAAPPAFSAPTADGAHPAGPRKKVRRAKPAPRQDQGESTADRERRLRRECRGLPNAGACQGFGWGS